jgi:hypothetical protein
MHKQATPAHTDEQPRHDQESNMEKPVENWVTGDEPMTGAQSSYLQTLCEETGEPFDENLTKAQASKLIDELKGRSPRLKAAS